MIDLYTSPTPNGHKVSCLLEALAMDYETHFVNLLEGEQHKPDFLKISPNGRIPAIVDIEANHLSIAGCNFSGKYLKKTLACPIIGPIPPI